jgi:hypothetical protein
MSIHSLVPDPQILLDMEPEELGAIVLQTGTFVARAAWAAKWYLLRLGPFGGVVKQAGEADLRDNVLPRDCAPRGPPAPP